MNTSGGETRLSSIVNNNVTEVTLVTCVVADKTPSTERLRGIIRVPKPQGQLNYRWWTSADFFSCDVDEGVPAEYKLYISGGFTVSNTYSVVTTSATSSLAYQRTIRRTTIATAMIAATLTSRSLRETRSLVYSTNGSQMPWKLHPLKPIQNSNYL